MESNKNVGIVGSKILFMDYPWIINSTGITTNIDMYSRDRNFGSVDGGINKGGSVIAVSGGAMAVRANLFNQVGLFDKSLFTYYEDIDFCLKVRRYTHYEIMHNYRSIVFHKLWGSSKEYSRRRNFFSARNNYIMMFRYLPVMKIPFRALRILKVRAERSFYWEDKFEEYRAFLSALLHFPSSIIERILMDIKYGVNSSYIQMLEKTKGMPECVSYPPDYAERRQELFPDRLPSRIISGVNDDFIGSHWSILLEEDGLKFREIVHNYAEMFLSCPDTGKHFVQIHLSGKNNIKVYFNNKIAGEFRPDGIWRTAIFPVMIRNRSPYYKIRIEGKGVRINEVALLSPTSPLLRKG